MSLFGGSLTNIVLHTIILMYILIYNNNNNNNTCQVHDTFLHCSPFLYIISLTLTVKHKKMINIINNII